MVMTCEKTTFVKTVNTLKVYQQKLSSYGNALAAQEEHK